MSCVIDNNNFENGLTNVIYGLLEPSTNEIRYIGKAVNLDVRIRKHFQPSNLKFNTHKNNWLNKLNDVGEKPLVVILKKCESETELNESEQLLIREYKLFGCKLTNGTEGGDGGKLTEDSLMKMKTTKKSNKQKGFWLNKKFSNEHREKISNSKRGYIASEKTKKKLSQSLKNKNNWSKGRKLSKETIDKMIISRTGKAKNKREVYQLSLENEIIKLWSCPFEAEQHFNLTRSKIHSVCIGKRKTTGGYKWRYKDEYDKQD